MSGVNVTNTAVWMLALASKDGLQRQAAREDLLAMGQEATPLLIRLLRDSHSRVRWEAALALKDLADPAAADALVDALSDENGDVRWVAAEGLAAIGEECLRPLLRALMEEADSLELRDAARVTISFLRDRYNRELLAPVYRAIKDGAPSEVVIMASSAVLHSLDRRQHSAA